MKEEPVVLTINPILVDTQEHKKLPENLDADDDVQYIEEDFTLSLDELIKDNFDDDLLDMILPEDYNHYEMTQVTDTCRVISFVRYPREACILKLDPETRRVSWVTIDSLQYKQGDDVDSDDVDDEVDAVEAEDVDDSRVGYDWRLDGKIDLKE